MGRVMRKGSGRHDMWFWVICIWNHLLKMAAVIGFSFKERFSSFQLLFPDFYHFHHVIWGMKWAKKLKTKNGQNMSSRPFSHDAAHMLIIRLCRKCHFIQHCFAKWFLSQIKSQQIQSNLLGFYERRKTHVQQSTVKLALGKFSYCIFSHFYSNLIKLPFSLMQVVVTGTQCCA